MAELRLQVEGISCGNCVKAVEAALLSVEGVAAATVGLDGASLVTLSAGCEADELQATVVAAVEGAGKAATVTSTVQPNPSAVGTPRPEAAAPVLELVEPEPAVLQLIDPDDDDDDEDDGAGVGFAKAPAKRTSLVDVGVDGSTPKEVRVIGESLDGGCGAPAVQIELPLSAATEELDDMAPEHSDMFTNLLDGGGGPQPNARGARRDETPGGVTVGDRFAAEMAFDKFCETQFGVNVMGPVAQHLSAWLTLPLGYQSAARRYAILEVMEKILDGAGSTAFSSALRRHGLVALEAVEGFHYAAEQTAERQGSDEALGILAAEHEKIRYSAYCIQLRVTGVRQRKLLINTEQWRLPTMPPAAGNLEAAGAAAGASAGAGAGAGDLTLEWEWREVSDAQHHVDVTVLFITPGMNPGDEITLQKTAHLTSGAGRYCSATEGEIVLMFSNEFSWVTNKEVELSFRRRGVD